jgi:N,N'-diacetyllegionaminate synthase
MKVFPSSFEVNNLKVGGKNPCLIIAEAGVSHFGKVNKGYDLVDMALDANADIFKMQHFKTEDFISDKKSEWFKRMKEKELTNDEVAKIKDYCDQKNITFLCTAHDNMSLDFLDKELDIPAFKIGSGEVQNWPFIADIASRGKPIILSTGMYKLDMIEQVINIIHSSKCPALAILHCVTAYPAKPSEINLKAMEVIRGLFNGPVGYSDHTEGSAIPLASVALGADIVEKHITIDRNIPNAQDWKVACDPSNFISFVNDIRRIEKSLGRASIIVNKSEEKSIEWARKSIFADNDISQGQVITKDDLTLKRPGDGIPGSKINDIIGKRANYQILKGKKLSIDEYD